MIADAYAAGAAPIPTLQIGGNARFIEKNQTRGVKRWRRSLPRLTGRDDGGAILLGRALLVKGVSIDTAQEFFGKRVLDIALVNVRFLGTLGGKAKAPVIDDTEAMTSKEASMKAVADSFDYGIALLKEQTDQTMLQKINASSIGYASRARVFEYLHSHTRQIDGQLALYLLLSGEGLPAGER